jgi:GT2 family glycosyltransferase
MIFSRKVFDEVGVFDTDFGAGARFSSAEDSDFLYRVYKLGLKIIYSPEVLIYHNHGRRHDEQIKMLNHSYAFGRGAFYCKHIFTGDKDILKLAYSEFLSLTKGIIKKIIQGRSITRQKLIFIAVMLGFMYRFIRTIQYFLGGIIPWSML